MTTHALDHRGRAARLPVRAAQQVRWLAGGLALGFAVPFVLADQLDVQRDFYYGLYAASVGVFFWAWARASGLSIVEMVRRRWMLAAGLGLAAAGLLSVIVLRSEDATGRPDGPALVGQVLWRGIVYGATDGLLLSAFPILAVFAAFAGRAIRDRTSGKIAIGALALSASLLMTGVYHLGYSDFRSEKVAKPTAGDVVWSVPTLMTLNPIGAPIAHAGMHVTAVLHSSETETFLPPHD
jgi:hypothetical protein